MSENKNVKESQLLLLKWAEFKEIVTVLQIPYKATIALQKHDLTLSDAFGIWLKIKIHLQSPVIKRLNRSNLANCLINALNERQPIIFNNPAMLSAIYLDPRYRSEISNDTHLKEQAIRMLLNLWRRLNCFGEETTNETTTNHSKESFGSDISIDFDDHTIVDKYLSRSNQSQSLEPNEQGTNRHDLYIEQEIELFQPEKLPSNASIISYWESVKEQNNQLYQLAMIIYAIPPAETQIERDFSTLEFIFSQRRQCLSSDQLEAILTINLNSDLFYAIKEEKILKMLAQNSIEED